MRKIKKKLLTTCIKRLSIKNTRRQILHGVNLLIDLGDRAWEKAVFKTFSCIVIDLVNFGCFLVGFSSS